MNLASELVIGGCRLDSVIGRGGMGTVYRATQLALGREVAVKVVPAQGVEPGLVERFQREARIAAELEHPHLVPIHAAGEEDGLLYLVMRLVNGVDLGALLANEGPLGTSSAVSVIAQVAGALDAVHAAGLVHRDVKPANVLIERSGTDERAYLSDFGLMRRVLEESSITRTGEWVGTIDYAAPEQLESGVVGPSADIYALGAVLYTAVTARPPYPRHTLAETAMAHATSPPPRVPQAEELEPVIARAMAKRPTDRYATAGELAAAARRAVDPPWHSRLRLDALGAAAVLAAALGVAALAGLFAGGGSQRSRFSVGTTTSFTFSYPFGWQIVEDDLPLGGFMRTRMISADGSRAVIIDRTPNEPEGLLAWATGVERATAQTPGYRRASFQPGTIGSTPAVVWRFAIAGAPYTARVDVFQRLGANGYAVLGEGPTLGQAGTLALSVARSLRPR